MLLHRSSFSLSSCEVLNMYRILFYIFATIVACQADIQVTPPPVKCGALPAATYTCLGAPNIVKPEVSNHCSKSLSECDRMTCLFRKSGWMDGAKLDKVKMSTYFDQFGRDHPEWQPAVERVKANCLAFDLPPQGIHLNCPAYDVMMCGFSNFIKNAQVSQWAISPSCDYPRRFAAACPVCPSDCFAPFIPNGSCNACLTLPRSP